MPHQPRSWHPTPSRLPLPSSRDVIDLFSMRHATAWGPGQTTLIPRRGLWSHGRTERHNHSLLSPSGRPLGGGNECSVLYPPLPLFLFWYVARNGRRQNGNRKQADFLPGTFCGCISPPSRVFLLLDPNEKLVLVGGTFFLRKKATRRETSVVRVHSIPRLRRFGRGLFDNDCAIAGCLGSHIVDGSVQQRWEIRQAGCRRELCQCGDPSAFFGSDYDKGNPAGNQPPRRTNPSVSSSTVRH
ncbi:hypothetical protein MAPG_08384 [Magnaporthiopsis poae ATCC 64411]|uniref:Uncharacterized protein n=1 Tax=Magnaporthiopsis poae (strain ATCC 64411 / 73-15) TaxID=644358 RepID=A0A0C4E781_MAGP6|nr:hypothetical protein MAPG_08384 [Magnaporthiopsis poae ATCC 64411]